MRNLKAGLSCSLGGKFDSLSWTRDADKLISSKRQVINLPPVRAANKSMLSPTRSLGAWEMLLS